MEPVPSVERAFFPLDEELALLPGTLAPGVQEHLTHLATWMPFRRAAQMLTRLVGVQVSEATIRRHTEAVGAVADHLQLVASQHQPPPQEMPSPPRPPMPPRLAVSADGAYVGLRKGVWAEVRTLVIAEVGPQAKMQDLSYFSRMTDAQSFAEHAEVETRRRGVVDAPQVCAVTDGAEWLQGFIDLHRPDAIRILDFAHAAQRFGVIAQAYEATDHALPAEWVQMQCHDLKHQGPRVIVERLASLPVEEAAQEHVRYLEKREAQMQYPAYQAEEWPIGSGMVESGNKVVMQARMKGAGMRWEASHVNAILALRTAVCNDRWDETWQLVFRERQQQRRERRVQRALPTLKMLWMEVLLASLRARPRPHPTPSPQPAPQKKPVATFPGSSRPTPAHPWKRTFIRRTTLPAKK